MASPKAKRSVAHNLRRPSFAKAEIATLRKTWSIVERKIIAAVSTNLAARRPSSYLTSDDHIFNPYIDAYALSIAAPLSSAYRALGTDILELVFEHERNTKSKVNKEQMYFAMSVNSLNSNDEINTLAYWELAQRQHNRTHSTKLSTKALIRKFQTHYTSIVSGIESGYDHLRLLVKMRKRYPLLDEHFFQTLARLPATHQLAYLGSGVRTRKTVLWLSRVAQFRSIRMFSRELVNQLCVICESTLRERVGAATSILFGDLLQVYVAPRLGLGAGAGGQLRRFFSSLPLKSATEFNSSYPVILRAVRRCALPLAEHEAYVLYGAYALRNKALHQLDELLWCYGSARRVEDAISLLFAAIRIARSL